MSYNLFLDDERQPHYCRNYQGDGSIYDSEEWEVVTDFDSFYNMLSCKGIPKFVSFDYKLGGLKTGLDCAEFLKFYCEDAEKPIPPYKVHSGWPGISVKFKDILG